MKMMKRKMLMKNLFSRKMMSSLIMKQSKVMTVFKITRMRKPRRKWSKLKSSQIMELTKAKTIKKEKKSRKKQLI